MVKEDKKTLDEFIIEKRYNYINTGWTYLLVILIISCGIYTTLLGVAVILSYSYNLILIFILGMFITFLLIFFSDKSKKEIKIDNNLRTKYLKEYDDYVQEYIREEKLKRKYNIK